MDYWEIKIDKDKKLSTSIFILFFFSFTAQENL